MEMQITIPDEMKEFLETEAATRGFPSPAEYLQALLMREKNKKALEEMLLEGIRSPKVVGDEAFWRERRQKIYDKHPELDPCKQTTPDAR